jgi:hypothetical protein
MLNELMVWLRADRVKCFPREVSLNRKMVHGDGFLRYVNYCRKKRIDCYASVFSESQIKENLFDTILFDVDTGVADVLFVGKMLEKRGLFPRVYYTSYGHAHLYCDFEPTVIKEYGDRCRLFAKELGIFDVVDKKVLGDKRRMARIPKTVNTKTGEIMEEAVNFSYKVSRLGEYLNSLEVKSFSSNNHDFSFNGESANNEDVQYPDCVLDCVEKLAKTGRLRHEERVFLGSYLVHVMSVDEAVEIFKCASDYNWKSRYYLQWFVDRRYNCYKCDRLKEMNICSRKCALYPHPLSWRR